MHQRDRDTESGNSDEMILPWFCFIMNASKANQIIMEINDIITIMIEPIHPSIHHSIIISHSKPVEYMRGLQFEDMISINGGMLGSEGSNKLRTVHTTIFITIKRCELINSIACTCNG